ncbi:O-antigen ligase family protein [Sphingomonas sp. HITSZ_GF]|uniref:O-antigen ligase family protein n=1 Tax=Sphingomonas sp. HITSZ_GF TaxID=3037247 RepID=UPI00240D6058|nr:O-antigen ligase family protein [Sphingomonas sp. HITSZ_GF]MDG2535777.1 O-antigen ligase family protein [Sphingomonas sp. HITSZ_GF]
MAQLAPGAGMVRGRFDLGEMIQYAVILLLPLTMAVEFRSIGTLYLHDFLSVLIAAVLLTRKGALHRLQPVVPFLVLLLIGLVGTIISDIYQATPVEDYSRAWARTAFFGINTVMIWLLTGGKWRLLGTYLFGVGLALTLHSLTTSDSLISSDPLKFGVGIGISLMIAGISVLPFFERPEVRRAIPVLLLVLALFCLFRNSRSIFATLFLALCFAMLVLYVRQYPKMAAKITPSSFAVLLIMGFVGAQLMSAAYGWGADSGLFGQAAQAKFRAQTAGDLNFLLAGRTEWLATVQAIKDSPIIGHGSFAKDSHYVRMYFIELQRLGLSYSYDYYVRTYGFGIPQHSFVLGAWVEGGILAALVWIWGLWLVLRAMFHTLKISPVPVYLVSVTVMFFVWDILFSPAGAEARVVKAVQICILVAAMPAAKKLRKPKAVAGGAMPRGAARRRG